MDIFSKRYKENNSGLLYSISWAVLSVSLINMFFIRSSLIVMGIAILMSVVYSIYILVDTHMIMGGKNKELSLDDYVLGSIILYVDIISLFLKILQILGKKKDDWSIHSFDFIILKENITKIRLNLSFLFWITNKLIIY